MAEGDDENPTQRERGVPQGPAETFTGAVRMESPFQGEAPGRAGGAIVTSEPGARTHWHTHPLDQTLIVTWGVGWTQCEGGLKAEIRADDRRAIPRRLNERELRALRSEPGPELPDRPSAADSARASTAASCGRCGFAMPSSATANASSAGRRRGAARPGPSVWVAGLADGRPVDTGGARPDASGGGGGDRRTGAL